MAVDIMSFFSYKIQMNQENFITTTTPTRKMSNSQNVWERQKILSQVYAESIFIIQDAVETLWNVYVIWKMYFDMYSYWVPYLILAFWWLLKCSTHLGASI